MRWPSPRDVRWPKPCPVHELPVGSCGVCRRRVRIQGVVFAAAVSGTLWGLFQLVELLAR